MDAGYVIAIEGADSVGHDTVIGFLREHFKNRGDIFFFREPWDGPLAGDIRYELRIMGHSKKPGRTPEELQRLYVQNRVEQWNRSILPNLWRRNVGISSRCFLSTVAYLEADGGRAEWVVQEHEKLFGTSNFPRPELCIILTATFENMRKRAAQKNDAPDAFEKRVDFQRKLIGIYHSFIFRQKMLGMHVVEVDANPMAELVFKNVLAVIESFMKERKAHGHTTT